jgi:hypothetical protein
MGSAATKSPLKTRTRNAPSRNEMLVDGLSELANLPPQNGNALQALSLRGTRAQ